MRRVEQAIQLIFPGFKIGLDDPRQAEQLVEIGVGGFCLYGGDVAQTARLTSRLQAKARRPLLFCADYEDGPATHCAGATAFPSNMGLGAAGSEELARQKGSITGLEARALGVHWVLAPVCDLATFPGNPIVNVRAFSDDSAAAARLAGSYMEGLKSRRILSCAKHFPGHGESRRDSHLELPEIAVDAATLERRELAPFRSLAKLADTVMTAHLSVPVLEKDPKVPYSLSSDVANTLRRQLGFEGLVSTDALNMRAVSDRFDELDAARRAVLGGNDILLVPVDARALARSFAAEAARDAALAQAAQGALGRLERARAAAAIGEAGVDPSVVGSRPHLEAAERMAEACLAWSGEPLPPLPPRLRYFEPDEGRAEDWLGAAFVEALRDQGLEVRPRRPGAAEDETLVLGVFLSPHAYTGEIELDEETRRRLTAALRSAPRAVVVSFGSPFVFSALSAPGLCAFSRIDASQRAAALALTGRLPVSGRMPVRQI